ncbi:response regulator [Candidatus Kuenenia stuttgartensis]|uniref:response regulator n=1 Tax=Kuenenia stuttgartiensis TaxID=174633 RepID=UPI00146AE109|nr:response regulator [Candidatus Kuenenia stuttgartiensis]
MANQARILIVEDKESNRNILNERINELGHISILAENGLSALAKVREQPPDIILLDIMMPEMDGYEVLCHLKGNASWRHIPVIMISAIGDMDSIVRCIEKGADDYLTKPFNPVLLKARIDSCLMKKRLHDQEEQYRKRLEDYNLDLERRVKKAARVGTQYLRNYVSDLPRNWAGILAIILGVVYILSFFSYFIIGLLLSEDYILEYLHKLHKAAIVSYIPLAFIVESYYIVRGLERTRNLLS